MYFSVIPVNMFSTELWINENTEIFLFKILMIIQVSVHPIEFILKTENIRLQRLNSLTSIFQVLAFIIKTAKYLDQTKLGKELTLK